MLQIVAVLSLTLGQTDRPPKLDFKNRIDYVAWVNAQAPRVEGDRNNAMVYYKAAGRTQPIEGKAKEELDACEGIWEASDYPALADYLEANAKHLKKLEDAFAFRKCWDVVAGDTDPLYPLLCPLAIDSRWATRAMMARAWMKQQDAATDQRAAIECAHNEILANKQHLQQSGLAIADLVAMSEGAEVYKSILRALELGLLKKQDFVRWFEQVQDADPGGPSWKLLVRVQWASSLSAAQFVCPEATHDRDRWAKIWWITGRENGPSDQEFEILQKADAREAVALIDAHFEAIILIEKGPLRWKNAESVRQLEQEYKVKAKGNAIARLFHADMTRTNEVLVQTETRRRGTLLTLAVHAHHAKHGKWPEDLGKIDAKLGMKNLKALRIDPFTGKRFIYKLKDGKPWLYSAGADGVDDGGKHHPKFGEDGAGGDYVFWPRQPK